jgi:hypothetical protein
MKRITATEAGLAAIRQINAARMSGLQTFTGTLTDQERRALGSALEVLLERPAIAACRHQGPADD